MEELRNLQRMVPFLAVSDMQRTLRHYRDGLAFRIRHEWVDAGRLRWAWLERDDVAIMVQEMSEQRAASRASGISLCVMCVDALAIYREVTARGVAASEPFVGNALWVTHVDDPDGHRMTFESKTDVAEDTRLSELSSEQAAASA